MLASSDDETTAPCSGPMNAYIGDRVRLARKRLGLSQGYVGHYLKVSYQQVQKFEKGINRISAEQLAILARVLGVPVHFFYQDMPTEYHMGGSPIAPADELPPVEKDVLFSPETHDLIRRYYAVEDTKKRRLFLSLLKAMNGCHS